MIIWKVIKSFFTEKKVLIKKEKKSLFNYGEKRG
jgi:hypothetical protein